MGEALHFKDNDKTIKINSDEKFELNKNKCTLPKTDYFKQYFLIKKHNSSIQNTLRFDAIISFKYYEKPLISFICNAKMTGNF